MHTTHTTHTHIHTYMHINTRTYIYMHADTYTHTHIHTDTVHTHTLYTHTLYTHTLYTHIHCTHTHTLYTHIHCTHTHTRFTHTYTHTHMSVCNTRTWTVPRILHGVVEQDGQWDLGMHFCKGGIPLDSPILHGTMGQDGQWDQGYTCIVWVGFHQAVPSILHGTVHVIRWTMRFRHTLNWVYKWGSIVQSYLSYMDTGDGGHPQEVKVSSQHV